MEINNLGICENSCNKKCYVKLGDYEEDIRLIQILCKQAIGRIFNDCNEIINRELEKQEISIEKFYELRDTKINLDDDENRKNAEIIQSIRKIIGYPKENDILEKAIPEVDFYRYVEKTGKVLGFIISAKYISNLKTSDDYIQSLALDKRFNPYNVYALRFLLFNPSFLRPVECGGRLSIPFNGGDSNSHNELCTKTGFTASKNKNNCPETFIELQPTEPDGLDMSEGSQIFSVHTDGTETLMGILDMSTDGEHGEFVSTDGEKIIKVENEYYKRDKDGNVTPIKIDETTIEIIEFTP